MNRLYLLVLSSFVLYSMAHASRDSLAGTQPASRVYISHRRPGPFYRKGITDGPEHFERIPDKKWQKSINSLVKHTKKAKSLDKLRQYCQSSKLTAEHLFFALMRVIRREEDISTIDRLLALGANINGIEEDNSTPGHISLGYTPLMQAAFSGSREVVSSLLKKGASVNVQSSKYGDTAFMLSARSYSSNAEEVQSQLSLLLRYGADPHIKNKNGSNAFLGALRHNPDKSISIAQWLVDKTQVDVKKLDEEVSGGLVGRLYKRTPAMLAWLKAHGARTE